MELYSFVFNNKNLNKTYGSIIIKSEVQSTFYMAICKINKAKSLIPDQYFPLKIKGLWKDPELLMSFSN